MKRQENSIAPAFQEGANPTQDSVRDVTVREAMGIFVAQTGYRTQDTRVFKIHEIMHILAGATNGYLADEGRAAVMEMIMLGCRFDQVKFKDDGSFVDGKYGTASEPAVRDWVEIIQVIARTGGRIYPELLPKIAKAKNLSEEGFQMALRRAHAVRDYFTSRHGGKSFIHFTLDQILDMNISEFGLEAREVKGKIQFIPFVPVEPYTAKPKAEPQ